MKDKIKQLADNLESSLSPLLEGNERLEARFYTNLSPHAVLNFISKPINVTIQNDDKHIRVIIQREYYRGIEGDRFTCEILTIGGKVRSLKFNKKTDTIEKIEKYVIDKMIKFINDQRNINQSMKLTESQENNIINELLESSNRSENWYEVVKPFTIGGKSNIYPFADTEKIELNVGEMYNIVVQNGSLGTLYQFYDIHNLIGDKMNFNIDKFMKPSDRYNTNESQENNIINELFGSKHKVFYLDQRTKRMHSFGVDRNPDVLSPTDIAKQFALVKGEEVGYFSCSKVGTNEERGIELLELKPKEKSPNYNNMIVFQNAKSMWSAKKAALDAGYIKFFSKSIF